MESVAATKVQIKILDSGDLSQPTLVLQVTQMVDTYMLWIGAADSNRNVGNGENAVLHGNLCKDWACAMPPRAVCFGVSCAIRRKPRTKVLRTCQPGENSAATSLFRSSSADIALSMAQRLGNAGMQIAAKRGPHGYPVAKRFKKQIFLSVDIPSGFSSLGGGQKLAFDAEKGIVAALKEIEAATV